VSALLLIPAIVLLLAGCGPLSDNETPAAGVLPSPTSKAIETLPPMRIVTRTPVDQSQIPPTAGGTQTALEVPSTYVVQEGDTLYSIAKRFQLDLAAIVALNGLSDPNDISVGRELMLPAPTE
jgi:LysM repeat protein